MTVPRFILGIALGVALILIIENVKVACGANLEPMWATFAEILLPVWQTEKK